MLKLYFVHTICHNSDMLRSILIIFSELLNINRAYIYINIDGLLNTVKFVHKMSADVIKFVCSSAELVRKVRIL